MLLVLLWILSFGSGCDGRMGVWEDWKSEYGRLLEKYVSTTGVDYAAWAADEEDREAIRRIVEEGIARVEVAGLSHDEQLAFYLNAYNAWILMSVVERYPIPDIFDGNPGYFRSKRIAVGGVDMTFHILENGVIRSGFDEPRVHFALNCGSVDCPRLFRAPFVAENIDGVMDSLTSVFINSPRGVLVDHEAKLVFVSPIFEWYAKDFEDVGGYAAFIRKYREEVIPEDYVFEVREYDWGLNEAME